MKIGIVIYSNTGNTLSVAKRVEQTLIKAGHEAEFFNIELSGKVENNAAINKSQFKSFPTASGLDAYIFASCTQAFSLNRVMSFYLNNLESVDAPVITLSTQHFMRSWMGGNRTQKQMQEILSRKGAKILGGVHVNWKKEQGRDKRIEKAVDEVVSLLDNI